MYRPNLQSVALAIPEIIAVLGWGCEPQCWGRGGHRARKRSFERYHPRPTIIEGRGWYRSKERLRLPIGSP